MKPLRLMTAMVTALLFSLVVAQETTQDPAEVQGVAMVRLVQLSPNATDVSVSFIAEEDEVSEAAPDEFAGLAYGETTDYMQVPAGDYRLSVRATGESELGETEISYEVEENFSAGSYTTLAVLGLVLPEEEFETDDEDEGFFAWLTGLFTGDDPGDRDALALRVESYADELTTPLEPNEVRLRVVHASPGTAEVDIVTEEDGEDNVLISNLSYADASGYETLEQTPTQLEIRLAGSDATALDLLETPEDPELADNGATDAQLEGGMVHTIFITGTVVEEVPLEALILSDAPVVEMDMDDPATAPVEEPVDPDPEGVDPDDLDDDMDPADVEADEDDAGVDEEQNVIEVAASRDELTVFTVAVTAAGLADTLADNGPYTVFAPNDDAFDALPEGQLDAWLEDADALEEVLLHHLVEGYYTAEELAEMDSVSTMAGTELDISASNGDVMIDGATVVDADLDADNGTVHVIDQVLTPEDE